jgi:hypothetical protein
MFSSGNVKSYMFLILSTLLILNLPLVCMRNADEYIYADETQFIFYNADCNELRWRVNLHYKYIPTGHTFILSLSFCRFRCITMLCYIVVVV